MTSSSGEPDQFAAAGRIIGYYESCHGTSIDDAPLARLEITKARDRERVYRELLKYVTLKRDKEKERGLHPPTCKCQVCCLLAEVAKMGG